MKPLRNIQVLAVDEAMQGALARFLASLGAGLRPTTLSDVATHAVSADLLLDRVGTCALAQAGLSAEQLHANNPRLIHVSVTPFGSLGPRSRWLGSELVASAMGGTLRLTGEPDRAPVKEALDACWFHADMAGAAGAMAALYEREVSGLGQHVDVSVQEVAFSRNVNGVLVWQFDRRKLHRVGGALNYGRATVRCIWPLSDGFCFHTLMTGRFGAPANQALSDWMDESGLPNPLRDTDWSRYNRSTLDAKTRVLWEQAIERFFRTRSRADIAGEGRRRGINATAVAEPADVLLDPHLQAREFWSDEGPIRQPGRFVRIVEPPATVHAAAVHSTAKGAQRPGPLAGLKVLDFSWALVGSITTKILGDLGCEVVKVESRSRPCLSRLDVQVSASRADSLDDKPWFAHLNTSKQSLTLDMKHAASREVLRPLIEWADIVVENFSPGTLTRLGLDYPQIVRLNPRVVMVSGSVFGQTGPLAQEWGVDGTGAALSGRTFLTGWPDRNPVIPGAVPYGDVIMPYAMVAAAAAAARCARMQGLGSHIDASMYELCVQQMSTAIREAALGKHPNRTGNDDSRVFHQGVYAAAGEDRWVAVTLPRACDWQTLADALHLPECDTEAQRHAALTGWLCARADLDAVETLQAAGVAAGIVQDIEDMMERDPQLIARCALLPLDHPLLGPFGHMRTPIEFSRTVPAPYRAPRMGEHTRSVLAELCGIPEHRIAELEALGATR